MLCIIMSPLSRCHTASQKIHTGNGRVRDPITTVPHRVSPHNLNHLCVVCARHYVSLSHTVLSSHPLDAEVQQFITSMWRMYHRGGRGCKAHFSASIWAVCRPVRCRREEKYVEEKSTCKISFNRATPQERLPQLDKPAPKPQGPGRYQPYG